MSPEEFLNKLKENPETVTFPECIGVIDSHYSFTPTAFKNGDTYNEAGQNNGSCKVFAFAQKHHLSLDQTLHCFGDFYRKEVLDDPDGTNHQNIRNFIRYGWEGIHFESEALK
jgi:hypothetical protein